MRKIILGTMLAAVIVLTILFLGCTSEKTIGGQRDEHGCLGPAGYSWDENSGVCARQWEITGETQTQAIIISAEHLKKTQDSYGITYTGIDVNDCEGCFVVHYSDKNNKRMDVTIQNWTVSE